MKYRELLDTLHNLTGRNITHAEISAELGGKPTANALANRLFNGGNMQIEELQKLSKKVFKDKENKL